MTFEAFYTSVGGDAQKVLLRLQSEALVRRFLLKYPSDPAYNEFVQAVEQNDAQTAFRAVHTIKGTAATLGLDLLADAASCLTEKLRGSDVLPDKNECASFSAVYQATLQAIAALDD